MTDHARSRPRTHGRADGRRDHRLRSLGDRSARIVHREGHLHRRGAPPLHRVRRADRPNSRRTSGGQSVARSRVQEARSHRADDGQQRGRCRLDGTHGIRHPQRLHRVPDPRGHPHAAQRDRLRAVLVLPATDPRQLARVVPHTRTTAGAWSVGHARCSPSSGCTCPTTSPCACRTPTRSIASW